MISDRIFDYISANENFEYSYPLISSPGVKPQVNCIQTLNGPIATKVI